MIRTAALLAPLLAAATSGTAEPWACNMTVQCENIDCFAIEDRVEIIAADHAGELFMTSPTGDRPVARLSPLGSLPAAYASAGPHAIGELVTITEDGQAIMSIHGSDGPARIITIFGTCEGL
jgi:antitoxin (DNA-binding transcriptional repressor) of toxin-antitoxin stability system